MTLPIPNRISPAPCWALVFCALFLTASNQAWGVTIRYKETSGLVTSIDSSGHTFTVQTDGKTTSVILHWDRLTEFFANDNCADAKDLRAGLRVRVRYVSPLFGKPEASRVFWRGGATAFFHTGGFAHVAGVGVG